MKKKTLSEETRKLLIDNGYDVDQLQIKLLENGMTLAQLEQIAEEIQKVTMKRVTIVVIGAAGVGKTSTINAAFGVEWKVGDGERGTEFMQEAVFDIDEIHKMKIIDLPGIGDSIDRDKETAELYKKILPTADVVLYIIQADDRAFSEVQYSINSSSESIRSICWVSEQTKIYSGMRISICQVLFRSNTSKRSATRQRNILRERQA